MCSGVFSSPLHTFTTWGSEFCTSFSNRVTKTLPVCMLRMRFYRASWSLPPLVHLHSNEKQNLGCPNLQVFSHQLYDVAPWNPTSMMSQSSADQIWYDLREGRKIVIVFYTLPILLNFSTHSIFPVLILPYLSTLCDSTKRGILQDISSYTTRRRYAQD